MKRILAFILAAAVVLSLAACEGNYNDIDIQKPVDLPNHGIVSSSALNELRTSNATTVLNGSSGGLTYSWLIFGAQVADPKDTDLSVTLTKQDGGICVTFADTRCFPAMLSITLDEQWQALTASAYEGGRKLADVALIHTSTTQKAATILNLPVAGDCSRCIILPDVPKRTAADSDRPNSDGSSTRQDSYLTDPIPEGKPLPVEPGQDADQTTVYSCIFSIECSSILNNITQLEPEKLEVLPWNGVILPPTRVEFCAGESVFDVLQRLCQEFGIHLESSWTPVYNSAYVEGIHNLYEFDCGSLSGWMYRVDGWYPNYGCSRYQLADGETVEWRFTCDLGSDVGCDWMGGTL